MRNAIVTQPGDARNYDDHAIPLLQFFHDCEDVYGNSGEITNDTYFAQAY